MSGRPQTVISLTGLTLAALLSACSSSPTATSTTTASMTAGQADTAAAALTAEADNLSDGATSTGGTNIASAFAIVPASQEVRTMSNPLLCQPTRSPNPPANSDLDAVPDSVMWDFAGCLINHPFAAESLGGSIIFEDPTPTVTDHAVTRIFDNFFIQTRRIVRGDTIMDEWNGPQTWTRDSSHTQFTENAFTLVHTFPNGSTASHVRTWSSTFTADTAGSIQDDTPLPSGLRNITGTSEWTFRNATWDFSVTTNPPLHRNDTCTTVPLFDSGTMTVVATRPSETTTITVTFTGCGQYTVTRS